MFGPVQSETFVMKEKTNSKYDPWLDGQSEPQEEQLHVSFTLTAPCPTDKKSSFPTIIG